MRTRRPSRSFVLACVLLAGVPLGHVCSSPRDAHAQASSNAVVAESLFRDARELMAKKDYAAACPKLEESQRLDPSAGTLLLLASCHEAVGKIATATTEYRDSVALAKRDGRSDRVAAAQARVDALEPRLSYLIIEVGPDAKVPGLEVTRDGVPLRPATWETKIPVDPGEHVIEARAAGYVPATIRHTVTKEGSVDSVRIPRLAAVAPPIPPVKPITPEKGKVEPTASSGGGFRTAGLITGGVGLIALGIGAYFGIKSIATTSEIRDLCDPRRCADPRGIALHDDALGQANAANVTITIGAVALVVGAILVITAPSSSRSVGAINGRRFGVIEF